MPWNEIRTPLGLIAEWLEFGDEYLVRENDGDEYLVDDYPPALFGV